MKATLTRRRPAVALAVLAIALLILLAGLSSSKTIDTASLGPATAILVYDNGQIVSERAVAPGSDEDRAVHDWLRSHPDGWRSEWNTHSPRRYVRGPRFTLNFQANRCILNYQARGKGRWVQVSRPLRRGEAVPAIFSRSR